LKNAWGSNRAKKFCSWEELRKSEKKIKAGDRRGERGRGERIDGRGEKGGEKRGRGREERGEEEAKFSKGGCGPEQAMGG
jgi:hypothetical protein